MTSFKEAVEKELVGQLYLAEQIDLLHLSLANLLDMAHEGEIDLILEQPKKSQQQKVLYLQKVVDNLASPELRAFLQPVVDKEEIDFFSSKYLIDSVKQIQRQVEAIQVVKLTVAVQFKNPDIREMAAVLAERIGRPVAFALTIDKSLIGGAIIRFGNYITDYSVKARLTLFREHWRKAVVESP